MESQLRHPGLAEAIARDYISSGIVLPGDALPGVRQLSRQYGQCLSSITVALTVLEERGMVDRKHGKGCFVREIASNKQSNNGLVGMILPSPIDAEIFGWLQLGAENACREQNCQLMIAYSDWSYEQERQQMERLFAAGCKCLLLYPVFRTEQQAENDYLNSEFRDKVIVLMDMAGPVQNRSQIVMDNYQAGMTITDYLINRGHRRIAFMTHRDSYRHLTNSERLRGYADAVRRAGLPESYWLISNALLSSDEVFTDVENEFEQWRRQPEASRPTAVIALEDRTAIKLASSILAAGLTDRLEVVGFDNLSIGRHLKPALTTTSGPFQDMGYRAVNQALLESTRQENRFTTTVLPVSLIVRND